MNELAKAVTYWLSYKAATGAAQLLTEGSLSIPIAESLFFHRWDIETQTDYNQIFSSVVAGKLFVDFYAKRGDERLVLETKFFKVSSQNLVFKDIVRLGLAKLDSVHRVLLLAWSASAKAKSYREFKWLLSLKKGERLTIDPVECTLKRGGLSATLSYNKADFSRLRELRNPVASSKIEVICADVTETATYGAAEYSIEPI